MVKPQRPMAYIRRENRITSILSIDFHNYNVFVVGKLGLNAERCGFSEIDLIRSTGKRDNDGRMMFEGDVYEGEDGHREVIEWDDYIGALLTRHYGRRHGLPGQRTLNNITDTPHTFVGSIYTNPNLLTAPERVRRDD